MMRRAYPRVLAAVVLAVLIPTSANAAVLSPRSVQLGTSQAATSGQQTFRFTTATTSSIGSVRLNYCTTPTGACVVPAGLTSTAATLTSQTGTSGFAISNTTNGSPYLSNSSAPSIAGGTALTFVVSNVTNPTATNTTFYVRIGTFTGLDGATGPVDAGTVATSTAQEVHLTGVTPEILVFCVGTAVTSDCSTMTGTTVDFGDFSPQSTRTATSVMQASTNAGGGYNVTVNGTTMSSGVNTIAALATQTASTVGVGQFGMNLRGNTSPTVGANPAGAGSGSYVSGYDTSNQFKFASGDTVASAPAPTNANTYTSSYIVNIGGAQPAGVYTATMTYICTANF